MLVKYITQFLQHYTVPCAESYQRKQNLLKYAANDFVLAECII